MRPLDIIKVSSPERLCQLFICADGMVENTTDKRVLRVRSTCVVNVNIQEVLDCLDKGSGSFLCRILADIRRSEFYRAFYDIFFNTSVESQVILRYVSLEEAHKSIKAHFVPHANLRRCGT